MRTSRHRSTDQRLFSIIDAAVKQSATPLINQDVAAEIKQKITIKQDTHDLQHIIESMLAKSEKGVIKLSPSLAKRILEEANFPRQRKIDPKKIQVNKELLRNGNWLGHVFPIHFASIPAGNNQPGKLWLVNGQHRLSAIAESDTAAPILIVLREAKNEEEASLWYTLFDNPKESRSDIQIIQAYGCDEFEHLPKRITQSTYRALAYLRNNLEPITTYQENSLLIRDRLVRIREMSQWAKEATAYWNDIKLAEPWMKTKFFLSSITAFALYTYRYQPGKAHDFWYGIACNDGLSKTDPRAVFINDLQNRSRGLSGGSRVPIQAVSNAWNAFCENREMKIIKVYPGTPIKVWGTPFANGNRT